MMLVNSKLFLFLFRVRLCCYRKNMFSRRHCFLILIPESCLLQGDRGAEGPAGVEGKPGRDVSISMDLLLAMFEKCDT